MYVLPPFLMQPSVLLLPGVLLALLLLFTLPAIMRGGNVSEVVRAAYYYLVQSLGVALMTIGGLPAAFAVFSQQLLPSGAYVGLLLSFAVGGMLYLRCDTKLSAMPESAREVPGVLFFYTWKLVGLVIALFSGLSAVLSLSTSGLQDPNLGGWWVNQMVLLLYGLVLVWFTIGTPGPEVRKAAPVLRAPAMKAPPVIPPAKKPAIGKMKSRMA